MRCQTLKWGAAALAALCLLGADEAESPQRPPVPVAIVPVPSADVLPDVVEVNLDAGPQQGRFRVVNAGARAERYQLRIVDVGFTKGAGVRNVPPEAASVASRITLDVRELALEPKAAALVKFTVADGAQFFPGTYVARMDVISADTGERRGSGTIVAKVSPRIAVGAGTPVINSGAALAGEFSATMRFRVEANVQVVSLSVLASPMFRGGNPAAQAVAPIPLDLARGVRLSPTNASPLGGSGSAAYAGPGAPVGAFPMQQSETVCFECGGAGRFTQDVFVTVWWNQDNARKPQGTYSGMVRLVAALAP